MKKLAFLVVLFYSTILFYHLEAQDASFSQFDNAPMILNPAMTGMYNGNHRILVNYRDQWSNILRGDSYKSASLSYDARITLSDKEFIGLGINAISDKAGALDYGTDQTVFLASYRRLLSYDSSSSHMVGFGIGYGIVNRHVDLTNARWASQHDGNGGFDPTLGPDYSTIITEFNHADLSIGLVWESILGKRSSFKLGFAMHHINRANVSFFGNDEKLTIRYNFHGSAEIGINSRISILPSFLHLAQGQFDKTMIGASGRLYFKPEDSSKSIQIGVWKWFQNEIISNSGLDTYTFSALLRMNRFKIGFSYDHSSYDFNGGVTFDHAYEFSLGYIFNTKQDNSRGFSNF